MRRMMRRCSIIRSMPALLAVSIALMIAVYPIAATTDPKIHHAAEAAPAQEDVAQSEFDHAQEYNYQEIDQYALRAPESAESSVDSLAMYLTAPARNDREKARAIYRWVAENIDYNASVFFSGKYGNASPDEVLLGRSSICEGYSNLFDALAHAAGLKSAIVQGRSKGYDYSAGAHIRDLNHAWNAFLINGSWYLADPTWGAGSLGEDGKFNRSFDDHYFMTPPSEFVYDHLPADPKWQLMGKNLTQEEFESLPYLKSDFFRYGLGLISHRNATIAAEGRANISISAPEDILLTARLDKDGQQVISPSSGSLTFAQRDGDIYTIYADLPSEGTYLLKIFTKRRGRDEYHWSAEYRIESPAGLGKEACFPKVFKDFAEKDICLYSPMNGSLSQSANQSFSLRVPGAEKVAVVNGDTWSYLNGRGDLFEGKVTLHGGEVNVFAMFPGEDSYLGLLRYSA